MQWVLGKDVRVPGSLLDDAETGKLEVQEELADAGSAMARRKAEAADAVRVTDADTFGNQG